MSGPLNESSTDTNSLALEVRECQARRRSALPPPAVPFAIGLRFPDFTNRQPGRTIMAMLLPDPFDELFNLQQALDSFRGSAWLQSSLSGGGAYPPVNVFRKGDDFIIIAELPGIKKSEIEIQVKGNTIRIGGTKPVDYPGEGSIHRRERLAGRFDRAISMPVQVDPDRVKAEYRDGILALYLARAEQDKPRSIKVS
jgi:HSP20 family protein